LGADHFRKLVERGRERKHHVPVGDLVNCWGKSGRKRGKKERTSNLAERGGSAGSTGGGDLFNRYWQEAGGEKVSEGFGAITFDSRTKKRMKPLEKPRCFKSRDKRGGICQISPYLGGQHPDKMGRERFRPLRGNEGRMDGCLENKPLLRKEIDRRAEKRALKKGGRYWVRPGRKGGWFGCRKKPGSIL